jgi:hypothetical protein
MKRLFLDTEFTDLVPWNKLISIALMTEDGKYFYAELTDTYRHSDCSHFVINSVLPYLKGTEYRMTEGECALKITQWIEDLGNEYVLAMDNGDWDYPHLQKLIEMTSLWPSNLVRNKDIKFIINPDDVLEIVLQNKFDVHNALDDAKVMMLAFEKGVAREYR